MTAWKPKCMAIMVAIIALSTEAQPLIPHAQGMNSGASVARRANPSGNGIPIKNAIGAINSIVTKAFIAIAKAIPIESNVGNNST